jgi:Tol biopolymer transport system component
VLLRIARVVACAGLIGCGFSASAPAGASSGGPDAPPIGGGSGSGTSTGSGSDGGAATDCLSMWMTGKVAFTTPNKLINQSSMTDSERDPWVSPDGLRLYYAFSQDNDNTDIYLATRSDTHAVFGQGTSLVNLNKSTTNDGRPALTPDEKTLVMTSDRDSKNGQFNILIVTRTDTSQTFATPDDKDTMANVNASNVNHFDPFISADGLHLYFAPESPTQQHINVASRSDSHSAFSNGQPLAINAAGSLDADPAVSNDDKILVFSSNRAGGSGDTDLWYATRTDPSQDFAAAKPIPNVNSGAADGDPMLSADGCSLYFSSTRGSGSYDLYSAAVAR